MYEDDEFWPAEFKKTNQAPDWRKQVQEELDDLGDLYELPEGIRIPGVRV